MSIQISENISLKDFTTFHVGGPARYFAKVKNIRDLKEALAFTKQKQIPFFILGGGSNILVSDQGYDGLIIKNEIYGKVINETENNRFELTVGSGENWDEVIQYSVENNLYGLENLSGIPGTVGATPVQNVGAYGSEVKDTIVSVTVFNTEIEKEEVFTNAQCEFFYRSSIFKKPEFKKYIILQVTFHLQKDSRPNLSYQDLKNYFTNNPTVEPTLSNVRTAVIEIRKGKFPDINQFGLAGSFFKNPIITVEKYQELTKAYPGLSGFAMNDGLVKISLAWILDHVCNLKGYRINNVGLFEKQPIVVINFNQATCLEIINFADEIKKIVKEKVNLDILEEVERV